MTTQAKHTPGPWSLEAVKDYMRPHDTGIDSEIPESIANAHLIAAAPDLLAALRVIAEDGKRNGWIPSFHWGEARAAIAKAEGEQ
jgi:hypothetical protein